MCLGVANAAITEKVAYFDAAVPSADTEILKAEATVNSDIRQLSIDVGKLEGLISGGIVKAPITVGLPAGAAPKQLTQ